MTIDVATATRQAEFSIGSTIPAPHGGLDMVNAVGNFMYGAHPWRFLQPREAFLDLRGSISISTGTVVGTTLTKTGAFANYTFLKGDRIEIESGSSATAGTYDVASRTDDDNIELEVAPGDTAGDLTATFDLPTLALPADFGENLTGNNIHAKDNLVSILKLVPYQDVLQRRSSPTLASSSWTFYGTIVHNDATPPAPIIEIYPTPNDNSAEHFRLIYRQKWVDLTTDDAVIPIKDFLQPLFLQCCIWWTRGLVEEDNNPLWGNMDAIMASEFWKRVVQQDARLQRQYGILRGGAVHGTPGRLNTQLRSEVSAPG